MIVVRHQAVRMDNDPEPADRLLERLEEPGSVLIVPIDLPALVSPSADMVDGVLIFDPNRAGHATHDR